MSIIYNLLFFIIAIIYLPIYLFRRKFHAGFLLRLGILPKHLELDRPIWIHAVSVGEAMAVRHLVEELRKSYPRKQMVISTVTATGNRIAQDIKGADDFVTYLPLDFSFIVRSVINRANPSLFIIAETEIWPNLITYLSKKNVPIVVVNGRISNSSFRGYLAIKFLVRPILNKINLFCAQTQRDAQRLIRLGVLTNKIRVTGNMKFDAPTRPDECRGSLSINGERPSTTLRIALSERSESNRRSRTIDTTDFTDSIILTYPNRDPDSDKFRELSRDTDYKLRLGLKSNERLWVAASTHAGEEEIILGVYKKLLIDFPNLRLLLAPRHPERTSEIVNLIKKFDFDSQRVSSINPRTHEPTNPRTIFILDTIGQLIHFYSIADIVFVGGSLVKKGGHNILEPGALGKPILFGPYMFNFRDIAELFLKNQAAVLVRNQEELKERIKYLLEHTAMTDGMSKKSKDLILQNQGATQRNLELIKNIYAQRVSL